jgi:deoxyribodipyrimidine photo-lyase
LARQFLDYEPGIHWSQLQMQSGTTGINTTRIYNPIKQAQDHDPHGTFVRRWLPAMRNVPATWLWQPWLMPSTLQQSLGLRSGVDIPQPLVDCEQATREAKQRIYERRHAPEVRSGRQAVIDKHALRKTLPSKKASAKARPNAAQQLGFDFE